MKKRFEWIEAKLEAGEAFNRIDMCAVFCTTTQTVSATIARFKQEHPGRLRYDGARKAFVRSDTPPVSRAQSLVVDLLDALEGLMPEGWGDDDTMDHMPGVKAARLAIAKARGHVPIPHPVALAVRALEEKRG